MAGTNRSREPILGGPAVILVEPQLGENIGTAARAMLNFGLTDLRLVKPRDVWPNPKAVGASSGATLVLDQAKVYDSTKAAIADLTRVFATTARPRHMRKDTVRPDEAAARLRHDLAVGEACGILFGAERAGLTNDDVALADTIITVPLNPAFSSLNLAQSVLLIGYEWFKSGDTTPAAYFDMGDSRPATREELLGFFEQFEKELRERGFLFPPHKAPVMARNLRNLFHRAHLTEQEVRTLRGVVKSLIRDPHHKEDPSD